MTIGYRSIGVAAALLAACVSVPPPHDRTDSVEVLRAQLVACVDDTTTRAQALACQGGLLAVFCAHHPGECPDGGP